MDDERSVERLESRAPGTDPEDPYEDVDLDSLPDWWQRAVEEFESHDLRPYRPPRFDDGVLVHEAVSDLESELGVEIRFRSVDTDYRERWGVWIDGTAVGAVGRHRSSEGYTVYELARDEFESLIRDAIDRA